MTIIIVTVGEKGLLTRWYIEKQIEGWKKNWFDRDFKVIIVKQNVYKIFSHT